VPIPSLRRHRTSDQTVVLPSTAIAQQVLRFCVDRTLRRYRKTPRPFSCASRITLMPWLRSAGGP
jgi:hypothetical protein